jgi:hypothetical protein
MILYSIDPNELPLISIPIFREKPECLRHDGFRPYIYATIHMAWKVNVLYKYLV